MNTQAFNTADGDSASPLLARFYSQLRNEIRTNVILVIFALTAFAASLIASAIFDRSQSYSVLHYPKILFSSAMGCFAAFILVRIIRHFRIREGNLDVSVLLADLLAPLKDMRLYARCVPLLLIASLGFHAFNELKLLIPQMVPFYLDDALIKIDRAMHFGKLPWEWGWSVTSNPTVLRVLDSFYTNWFTLVIGLWCWAAVKTNRTGWERQYVLSFVLLWVIAGVVFATLLSSVGPCFYADFHSTPSPYADQMAHLKSVSTKGAAPLAGVIIQEVLLTAYADPSYPIQSGISAMPSLHNAAALLFVFAGYRMHKWIGRAFVLNMIMIFIGSVVLGWHYAIDAYLGWALAAALWFLSAWLIRCQDSILAASA